MRARTLSLILGAFGLAVVLWGCEDDTMMLLSESSNPPINEVPGMQRVPYKGYEIQPLCQKIKGENKWTLEVVIIKPRSEHTGVRPFSAANTFPTKESAEAEAIELAKKIIDGSIPEVTVADL